MLENQNLPQERVDAHTDTEEIDKLLPEKRFVATVTGQQIEIPVIVWKREVAILRALGKLIAVLPKELFQTEGASTPGSLLKSLSTKLPAILGSLTSDEALEQITAIAAEVIGRDSQWVEENLSSVQIVELIIPFLLKRAKDLTTTLPKLTRSLPDLQESKTSA